MSLAKSDVIDLVALTPDKRNVALIAFDDGVLPADETREQALHKKLAAYLQFVSSGQFVAAYPQHADRGVGISVVCMNPPSEEMRQVEAVRDHDRPDVFLPVEVMSDAEFREALRSDAHKSKPWWKFWS